MPHRPLNLVNSLELRIMPSGKSEVDLSIPPESTWWRRHSQSFLFVRVCRLLSHHSGRLAYVVAFNISTKLTKPDARLIDRLRVETQQMAGLIDDER